MRLIKHILKHFLLVLGNLSIPILLSPDLHLGWRLFEIPPFQRSFFNYGMAIIFFYGQFYLLIPRFFEKQSKFKYWLLVLISLLIIGGISHQLFQVHPPFYQTNGTNPTFESKLSSQTSTRLPGWSIHLSKHLNYLELCTEKTFNGTNI